MIDTCLRLLPGFLGSRTSSYEESFGEGVYQNLLEYPHYTRPYTWHNYNVPEVLTSGNHKKISQWRLKMAKEITREKRPELWLEYKNCLYITDFHDGLITINNSNSAVNNPA